MRWTEHVTHRGERRGVYRVWIQGFGEKTWEKETTWKTQSQMEDNIKINLQEVGYGSMEWIELARDRDRWRALVTAVMNLLVPWNVGNFLTSREPVSFSRRNLLHGVSEWVIEWLQCCVRSDNKNRRRKTPQCHASRHTARGLPWDWTLMSAVSSRLWHGADNSVVRGLVTVHCVVLCVRIHIVPRCVLFILSYLTVRFAGFDERQ